MLNFVSRNMLWLFASDFIVSFLQEFGDQGEDSIILSPRLQEICTPDRPTALRFLGTGSPRKLECLVIWNGGSTSNYYTHALLKSSKYFYSYNYLWLVFVCV
jgi:hypothetical protein